MQWLVHGTVGDDVRKVLVGREDVVHSVGELELGEIIGVEDILRGAGKRQWDLVTNDAAVAEEVMERGYGRSVVLLKVLRGDVEEGDAMERLFGRYRRLTPGRLYVVTEGRVKVRQMRG